MSDSNLTDSRRDRLLPARRDRAARLPAAAGTFLAVLIGALAARCGPAAPAPTFPPPRPARSSRESSTRDCPGHHAHRSPSGPGSRPLADLPHINEGVWLAKSLEHRAIPNRPLTGQALPRPVPGSVLQTPRRCPTCRSTWSPPHGPKSPPAPTIASTTSPGPGNIVIRTSAAAASGCWSAHRQPLPSRGYRYGRQRAAALLVGSTSPLSTTPAAGTAPFRTAAVATGIDSQRKNCR
jgi:hypothetical protein